MSTGPQSGMAWGRAERWHDLIAATLPVCVEDKWVFTARADEHAQCCLAKVRREEAKRVRIPDYLFRA
jgi:hypothetical protein